jgi:hypothetical protein
MAQVRGDRFVGGLAGRSEGSSAIITNSYSTAQVQGRQDVGGLLGFNANGTVTNSYATGDVSGVSAIGGLVGLSDRTAITTNSYAIDGRPLIGYIHLGTVTNSFPRTTAQMHQRATFTDWDFSDIWHIREGYSYPQLRVFLHHIEDDVAIIWSEENEFTFNGTYQGPSATATLSNGLSLQIELSGNRETNAGEYTAEVLSITIPPGIGVNFVGEKTMDFSIIRANITPTVNISSNIRENVVVSPTVRGNIGNGAVEYLYSETIDGEFLETPPTEMGDYYVKAIIAQTPNFNGAQTPPVAFSIVASDARQVDVIWDDETIFTYNGEEQAPTATASTEFLGTTFPVPLIITREVNAGTWTAFARLETPSRDIFLEGDAQEFTILPKEISPDAIMPIGREIITSSDNRQIKPNTIVVTDGEKVLLEGRDYEVSFGENVGKGDGSVTVTGRGNYTGTAERSFVIAIWVDLVWGSQRTFTYNGTSQAPTATAGSHEIEISGKQINAGSHVATALSKSEYVVLTNPVTCNFDILPKPVQVTWDSQREFVYNKMIQYPSVNLEVELDYSVLNTRSEVGVYEGADAPFVFIPHTQTALNYNLIGYRLERYEITPRELHLVIRENGEIVEEVEVERLSELISEDYLISLLLEFLGYYGFARDTVTNEADDESDLEGELSFDIRKRGDGDGNSQRGLRSLTALEGEYIVEVKTDDIVSVSRNYQVTPVRQIAVTISDDGIIFGNEFRPNDPVSIRRSQRNESGGINFAQNPVSDKAEIFVADETITRVAIFDALGNLVFDSPETVWNLRNTAGRRVAEGTYLVVVEARDKNGRTQRYSARLGVKR